MKRIFIIICVVTVALWFGGGVLFVSNLPSHQSSPLSSTDQGIVVLTGGSDRIEAALKLLRPHTTQRLFISGVYRYTTLKDILKMAKPETSIQPDQIELDYRSRTTRDNAHQGARWVKDYGFKTIQLVTAHYHLPRAHLEFQNVLPGVEIIDYPVLPRSFNQPGWFWHWDNLSLLWREYHKYLGVRLRLMTHPLLSSF